MRLRVQMATPARTLWFAVHTPTPSRATTTADPQIDGVLFPKTLYFSASYQPFSTNTAADLRAHCADLAWHTPCFSNEHHPHRSSPC